MYHQYRHHEAPGVDKLWIITPISNPQRYQSRYRLYNRFEEYIKKSGANLMTVELALGDRPHEAHTENHLKLRAWDELWHKENMINVAISRLPEDWEYVAWIDCDIEFVRQDWIEEIVHQLQHYQVIQLFQTAIDLGPSGEAFKIHNGFVWSWQTGQPNPYKNKGAYALWHPGFAWAARREAIDHLGGLLDIGILGASDHHMAHALIGEVMFGAPAKISKGYKRHLLEWQDRATKHIRGDIGYMPGTIHHHWHGKKKDRKYNERWEILVKHGFDPDQDLKKDWQGLYQFTDSGTRMRNDIRNYFKVRNEDSIDP